MICISMTVIICRKLSLYLALEPTVADPNTIVGLEDTSPTPLPKKGLMIAVLLN